MQDEAPAQRVIDAWQCSGCGKLEALRQCIGVCEFRKVAVVEADALARSQERVRALEAVLGMLVRTEPAGGQWAANYRALQGIARRALGTADRRSED